MEKEIFTCSFFALQTESKLIRIVWYVNILGNVIDITPTMTVVWAESYATGIYICHHSSQIIKLLLTIKHHMI